MSVGPHAAVAPGAPLVVDAPSRDALDRVPIDELPVGLLVIDAQGRLLRGNRMITDWLGRSEASLIGVPFVSLLDTGSAWLWEMFALPRLALSGQLDGVAVTCVTPTGSGRPLVLGARPFRSGDETAYRLALVDGSLQREQTRRGAAAAARANRLARVVENATGPVVLVDERLRIVAHNPATVTFLGVAGDALAGQCLDAFVARQPDAGDLGAAIRAQARGAAADAEFGFRTGSGGERAALVKATALHASDEDDPAYGVFLIDMTERRRLETLGKAMREAEVAARERRDVLSRVSHEFLTPLNAVLGFTRMAMEDAAVTRAPHLHRQLAQVHGAGRQLVSLVDAVLGLTRDEGVELLAPAPMSVGTLLQRCVAATESQARQEDIRVQAVCADAQAELLLPLIQVEQCLVNLVSNAIRYSGRGGTVQVRARVRAGRLLLHVLDDGPGLERGSLQRAFLPFERLDAGHRGIEGVGLGLAVSRSILTRMGGALRARSRPHRLTIFTAELPARLTMDEGGVVPGARLAAAGVQDRPPGDPTSGAVPAPDARIAGRPAAPGPFTVLLAEASPFPRMLVEMAFAEFPDWHLAVADDADALRSRCARDRPDVVLLDDAIARALGPDWPRCVRELAGSADIRFVLIADERSACATAPGADAFVRLARPLAIPQLIETLSAWAAARD